MLAPLLALGVTWAVLVALTPRVLRRKLGVERRQAPRPLGVLPA